MFREFTIILPLKVREKIQYWVDKADKEISGLGDAWLDIEKKTVTITSAFLLDQECTASDTELDDEAINKVMFEAHQDEMKGIKRNVKFWWHSHVNMDVFWSGTDVEAMNQLSEHGWFCNIVFNKKREMRGAISYPVLMSSCGMEQKAITYNDKIPVFVPSLFTADEVKEMDEQFKEKYKEKKVVSITTYNYNTGAHSYKPYTRQKPGGDTQLPLGKDFNDPNSYWDEEYWPTYGKGGDADDDDIPEKGDVMDDGSVCLYADHYITVVQFYEEDQIWFNKAFEDKWRALEDCADLIYKKDLEDMDIETIDAMWVELEHKKKFPLVQQNLMTIIDEKEKAEFEAVKKEEENNNGNTTLN